MSHRSEDRSFMDEIRDMKRRIQRLESQGATHKRNDIRIGDAVLTTDTETNRIEIKNLKTEQTDYIGNNDEDAKWSFSGLLTDVTEDTLCAPPHVMARNDTATEIVLAFPPGTAVGDDFDLRITFNSGTIVQNVVFPAGETVWVIPINVPVTRNTTIVPCFLGTEGLPANVRDLSVFVRFSNRPNRPLSIE